MTPNFPAYPSGHASFGGALFQVLRLTLDPGGPTPISLAEIGAVDQDVEGGRPPTQVAGETFTFVSDEFNGKNQDPAGFTRPLRPRAFQSYAHACWENAVSRAYLGVHWKFDGLPPKYAPPPGRPTGTGPDNVGGVPIGLEVGEVVHAFFAHGGL